MTLTVDDVLQRLAQLKTIRQPYEAMWQDVTDYVLPRRSMWDIESIPGQKPDKMLHDSTALTELQTLVDGTIGNLVSLYIRWIHLLMEDRLQNDAPWVRDWLEDVENVLYAAFERSNFYDSFSEYFMDGASIGTGIMLVEDDVRDKSLLFSTRHMKECYIAEGRNGKVDTVYREFKMSNRQIMQLWGDRVSQQRKEQYKERPYAKGTIIHACFPRSERDPSKIDKYNKAWVSLYIDKEFNDKKDFLDEGGYDSFPYLVWRWRKNSDEWYGRSPASDSISDVMRLNQMGKAGLQVAQLAAQPPLNVPQTMKGKERIVPRGYNYYVNKDEMIYPINLGQNYPIAKDQEKELKEQIKDAFRTKMFMIMNQLEGGPRTATEINARQGEGATIQSSLIGRLNSESLIPLISRVYTILDRNGQIPLPPPGAGGGRIRIEFQGRLAQQIKKYSEVQGVDSTIPFIQIMREMAPESLDNWDADEYFRVGLDSKGASQKSIREKPEVTEIRKIRQAQQEEQQKQAVAMEQQKVLAGNADKLNEPVKPDSMLAGIGKAAQQGTPAA